MDSGELLTIGRFARLTGLSAHTLRHYDEVGLLRPHEVDASSGYRRYRRAQIQVARTIVALRRVGLPIEDVRRILASPADDDVRETLLRHRRRLELERSQVEDQIRHVTRYIKKGIPMPVVQTGCRPVQLRVAVDDKPSAMAFHEIAFDLPIDVARRTQHSESRTFVFGEYGEADFFLLWLTDDRGRFDRPGRSNFSFLVEDVDATFAAAVAAGATEVSAPREMEGMPRSASVQDPSGNLVGLAQG
jgi:DNA-binding transcriptional MerR regulator